MFKFFFYFLIIFSFWAHDIQADNLTYWQRSAGNDNSNKHANLDQINKNNINSLKIAWVFHSGIKSNSEVTPIFNNGYIFTTSKNSIFAVNPYNGKKIWETKLNLNKTLYLKSQYERVIDTEFSQLATSPSPQQIADTLAENAITPSISINQFFEYSSGCRVV